MIIRMSFFEVIKKKLIKGLYSSCPINVLRRGLADVTQFKLYFSIKGFFFQSRSVFKNQHIFKSHSIN